MTNLNPTPFPRPDVNNHDHPHTHPLDIDAIRTGLLALAAATPTTIQPDDAAAVGTSQQWARSDHRHAIVGATASALTETATSAEGASTSFARADHTHATSVLPYGVLPNRFSSTVNGSSLLTGATSDITMTNTVDSTRAYEVMLQGQFIINNATSAWELNGFAGGTQFGRFVHARSNGAGELFDCNRPLLYLPASSGSVVFDVRVTLASGTAGGSMTFQAGATFPRRMWMTDIGPQ